MVRADPRGGFRFSYGSERRPLATDRANRSCPTGWHDGSFRGGSAPASLKRIGFVRTGWPLEVSGADPPLLMEAAGHGLCGCS